MENFTNETIDTKQLPKYEEIQFTVLQKSYWIIILIRTVLIFLILGIATVVLPKYIEELASVQIKIGIAVVLLFAVVLFFLRISFNKKAFAFRNHDVLFREGIIATSTMVIPYNRIQHVALHEGLLSRYFGLAKVEIFTAGGHASDLEIPGIAKEEAENIKQLLMVKIQKQL